VTLEVPVPGACHAETARRLAGDDLGDFLDEAHRRAMWQQVEVERS
jgi:hypothetical protein